MCLMWLQLSNFLAVYFMSIAKNISEIRNQILPTVKLVCVSKFHSDEAILEAYNAGERVFGESKVQEMTGKQERLPKDIQWHFIGHLQSNKVKYIVPYVHLIHGVDSLKLLQEINLQAKKINRTVNCLLQVHIAAESTKFGFDTDEITTIFKEHKLSDFSHVNICGLMGMATFTDDLNQVKSEFEKLKSIFDTLKADVFSHSTTFSELSMGMSDDYKIAIDCGSTMIRVGSLIFGNRVY